MDRGDGQGLGRARLREMGWEKAEGGGTCVRLAPELLSAPGEPTGALVVLLPAS